MDQCLRCPVVRLSGEYVYQRFQMTTYSVTSHTIGNRPVYKSDTTINYLFYQESLNEWLVGHTPGENIARLAAQNNATLPESISQGTFEVFNTDSREFVMAPNLRVSCSVPGYIGCYWYVDVAGGQLQWTGSNITIDNCRLSCRVGSFLYTALFGRECWCATHITVDATRSSGHLCDKPCGGNPLQFCGRRNDWWYTEVYKTITDCGPVPVTPGVTSVRPSYGANITVGQTVEVVCWNGITETVQCLQNGSFDSSNPFCPEPTTTILETSEGSTKASPELRMDDRSGDKSTNIIPIVGGVVAGLVFVVIAAVAAFFLVRKRNAGLAQETPASSQRGTNLGNSTYYEPVMSDVVLTDTGAQYLPNAGGTNTSAAHPRATDVEPQYSTIPEYSTIDEMDRKGVNSPQTKNNNLDQLYSKPVKKTKDNREEGMVDNVLYETSDDVIDGEGATGCNAGQGGYVDNDMYG
ncbi:uncharacterized protein [Branchiostoma lanceolatum]|uniref:uncharacterized protein isoform X2 n=1 Tax=Branchiostoma lanceolatum TaxID=7740 RepID=UPI0034519A08